MGRLIPRLLGAVLLALSPAAFAAVIGLAPPAQDATAPGTVEVAVVVSGLGDGTAPSIGAFDVQVAFDPALLLATSIEYGDRALGNQLDLFSLGSIQLPSIAPGAVQIVEISLDLTDDLNALQAPAFTLAYIHFSALAPGAASLTLSVNSLADAVGDPLDYTLEPDARVAITGTTAVPEPGTFVLTALALASFAVGRRRSKV